MVEQGKNHPEREGHTFRGREKYWYTSELKGGNTIRALSRISTRKAKKWSEWLDQSAFTRLCYSNKQAHLSGNRSLFLFQVLAAGQLLQVCAFPHPRPQQKEQVLSQPHGREKSTTEKWHDGTESPCSETMSRSFWLIVKQISCQAWYQQGR